MTHKKFKLFIMLLALCEILAFVYLYQWGGCPVNPIRSDGWGYYSYLPAIFDYKDLSFSFSHEAIDTASIWYDINGNVINKYPIGVSILQFPFYIVVDIFCKIFFPASATGYTAPYQLAVLCATTFYFLLGIYFLYKVLHMHFSCKVTGWVLLSICFGTSLFHYATYDASFSHIYSFFAINSFVYLIEKKIHGAGSNFFLGLLTGLILILRNPNVVVLLFYFLYEVQTISDIKNRIVQLIKPTRLLPNILGGLIPVCLQCLYWYHATGNLVIRSYNEAETFNWLMPHIAEVLFSVSKGLIFYSPIIGIALCGIFIFRRTINGFPLYAVAVVIFAHLYITASWDCWQYGGSFGQRPFVDVYIFYALYLGSMYEYWNNLVLYNHKGDTALTSRPPITIFNLLIPLICVLIFLSLKFMLAYWHGILPFADTTMQDISHVLEWNFNEVRTIIQHLLQG